LGDAVNETWIADRDRFSYEGLYHEDRLTSPMIKQQGAWHECDWETALEVVRTLLDRPSGAEIGGLISPSASNEELFLFKRLMAALGSPNLDYRLRRADTRGAADDGAYTLGEGGLAALEDAQALFLVGADLHHDQPMVAHRVRKAWLNGADIAALGHRAYDYRFGLSTRLCDLPSRMASHVARIAKAVAASKQAPGADFLKGVDEGGLGAQEMLAEGAPVSTFLLYGVEPEADSYDPQATARALRNASAVIAFTAYRSPLLLETAQVLLPIAAPYEYAGSFTNLDGLAPETAGELGLADGDRVAVVQGEAAVDAELRIDDAVPAGAVFCPAGPAGSERLGAAYGPVDVQKK